MYFICLHADAFVYAYMHVTILTIAIIIKVKEVINLRVEYIWEGYDGRYLRKTGRRKGKKEYNIFQIKYLF